MQRRRGIRPSPRLANSTAFKCLVLLLSLLSFTARGTAATYELIDLGNEPYAAAGGVHDGDFYTTLNNKGEVAGFRYEYFVSGSDVNVVHSLVFYLPAPAYGLAAGERRFIVDTPKPGAPFLSAAGFNDHGLLVGWLRDKAFTWNAGAYTELNPISTFNAVNNSGAIVGTMRQKVLDASSPFLQEPDGQITQISSPANATPIAMTDQGEVLLSKDGQVYMWQAGVSRQITALTTPAQYSPADMNNLGEIVGANAAGAYLYLPKANYGLSAGLHALTGRLATKINDLGQVTLAPPTGEPQLWDRGTIVPLHQILGENANAFVTADAEMVDVNNRGEILVRAQHTGESFYRALLLRAQSVLGLEVTAQPEETPLREVFTLTATVKNESTDVLTHVLPKADPTFDGDAVVEKVAGPQPAEIATLPPGATAAFAWTFRGTMAGEGAMSAEFQFTHQGDVEAARASSGKIRILESAADLLIKVDDGQDSNLASNDVYQKLPIGGQKRSVGFKPKAGSTVRFLVEVQNDDDKDAEYILTSTEEGDSELQVKAIVNGADQWAALKGAGLSTGTMAPGASIPILVTVSGLDAAVAVPPGKTHQFSIFATRPSNPATALDAVSATVTAINVITVNSTGDQSDADAEDGVPDVDLAKPGLQTTLRAAIEFANKRPGKDVI